MGGVCQIRHETSVVHTIIHRLYLRCKYKRCFFAKKGTATVQGQGDQPRRRTGAYVSIYVPGTGRETSSDMSGNFSIKAKHKETVYFRYIGMKDVQIQLDKDNPSEILVQIKPDTFRLDNVIIRKKQIIEVKPEDIPNDIMITIIEHSPDFPGGLSGLREYLKKSIQYPKKAFRAGEEGQVTIEFTIDPKGNVINAQVVKSVSAKLDKEALRIIESMPQWKPGMQRGRPVAVRMSVPIDFVIDQVYKAID
ncbi:TonB family protein [Bacteroides thetaiotaomicron]|nr:TonB family protein [Bacteroides thetaiotaomicron]